MAGEGSGGAGGGGEAPLRVMVNGMPGKMATAVAEVVVSRGLTCVLVWRRGGEGERGGERGKAAGSG